MNKVKKKSTSAHSGNKYHRSISDVSGSNDVMTVDVYCVLSAFQVHCPATQHAIKKLLCCGIRGKGDTQQDLSEAKDAISRAIELDQQKTEIIKGMNENHE